MPSTLPRTVYENKRNVWQLSFDTVADAYEFLDALYVNFASCVMNNYVVSFSLLLLDSRGNGIVDVYEIIVVSRMVL